MNLAAARSAFAERGFDYLSGAAMNRILNRARNDFEDHWPWPWLQATTTGPAPLVLTNLKHVRLVNTATGGEVSGSTVEQLRQGGADLTLTGSPLFWYLTADTSDPVAGADTVTMLTWPASTGSLTVLYTRQSPELVADADEPLIPTRYQLTWIDLAVVQAYQDSDNFPAATALQQAILARLNSYVERYETRNRQNTQTMSVRAGSLDG